MTESDSAALIQFQEIADASVSIIALVQGRTRQRRDFWAYVAARAHGLNSELYF